MNTLPERPSPEHLRKQAKDLLRLYRAGDPAALERLRHSLPAARGRTGEALQALELRLHDMQSCIAREYGFPSWGALNDEVEIRRARGQDPAALRRHWLALVFGGDLAGGTAHPRPALAARMLADHPDLMGDDPWLACAVGDVARVRRAIEVDGEWVRRSGGPLNVVPLIAVAHSSLVKLPAYRAGIIETLKLLLGRGADPNAFYRNRWSPHSLEQPGEDRLSALYGAAGKHHDLELTRLLLAAGADPNDGESLYHSVEDPDPALPCTRALLAAGGRVLGSNALARILDIDNLAGLELLLAHTPHGDPDLGRILHKAIHRGRSAAHVRAILAAGADPKALDGHGQDAFRQAVNFGLPEIMRLLERGGSGEPLTDEEKFVTACARADEAEARRWFRPGIFARLTPAQLKQLPNVAMCGRDDAVRLMVRLGWPIATRGGDIDGSALNWAVFRGRPELADFLLGHGASYHEPHGYQSDVLGTLSWASLNQPRNDGDWPGCAAVLLRHGLPRATALPDDDPASPVRRVLVEGRVMPCTPDVADVLLSG